MESKTFVEMEQKRELKFTRKLFEKGTRMETGAEIQNETEVEMGAWKFKVKQKKKWKLKNSFNNWQKRERNLKILITGTKTGAWIFFQIEREQKREQKN